VTDYSTTKEEQALLGEEALITHERWMEFVGKLGLRRHGQRHEMKVMLSAVQLGTLRFFLQSICELNFDHPAAQKLYDDTTEVTKRRVSMDLET
jgi:hypothetical protein